MSLRLRDVGIMKIFTDLSPKGCTELTACLHSVSKIVLRLAVRFGTAVEAETLVARARLWFSAVLSIELAL